MGDVLEVKLCLDPEEDVALYETLVEVDQEARPDRLKQWARPAGPGEARSPKW